MEPEELETNSEDSVSAKPKSLVGKILRYAVIGLVAVALAIGGWLGLTELRINSLIEQTQSSLASGDLQTAEDALSNLEGLDPTNNLLGSLQIELDYALKFATYEELLRSDDLDGALAQLGLANEIKPSSQIESLLGELVALQNSKANFEAGLKSLGSGDYKQAYSKFEMVTKEDLVRNQDSLTFYEEAVAGYLSESLLEVESKLGSNDLGAYKLASEVMRAFPDATGFSDLKSQAEESYGSKARVEAEKLVKSGFYISAFRLVDRVQADLSVTSPAARELGAWFDPIFEDAKESALKNDMAIDRDSFTDETRYYYKGTYRTIGSSLLAADRFRLYIIGKTNPRLALNVMLYQDDWVFANSIQANIDGTVWTIATDSLFGDDIERDNGSGYIWEYIYRYATDTDVSYMIQARESKKTVIRFQGDQGRSDFTVSSAMKIGIEKVLLAYLALGGSPSVLK